MTWREKMLKEKPNMVDDAMYVGGVAGCPEDMDDGHGCSPNDEKCAACWNREIRGFFDDDKVEAVAMRPTIKDSGDRTQFESGAVRDMHAGKGRMDLLPWAAIMEVSKHCENGAIKYGEHNVDKGIPTSSLCDSAARHLAKYLDGWVDEPHLLAATWNLLWALQMELKNKEMVNTPWKRGDAKEDSK